MRKVFSRRPLSRSRLAAPFLSGLNSHKDIERAELIAQTHRCKFVQHSEIDFTTPAWPKKIKTPPQRGLVGVIELLAGARLNEVAMYFGNELASRRGGADLATQHLLEWNGRAIEVLSSLVVLLYFGTVDVDASEEALGSRVSQDFAVKFPVCAGCGSASNGPSGCAGICANPEFAREQLLGSFVVHHEH